MLVGVYERPLINLSYLRASNPPGVGILNPASPGPAPFTLRHFRPRISYPHQCYVVAAAQWGQHNSKRVTYGHSMIVTPWGEVLGEKAAGDGLLTATLSAAAQAQVRAQLPCLQHAHKPS
ncbi:MAG: hypothetical protein IPL79_06110 [Myxococcales bacterium]|nr:hypothetical protein [Myxococcales bacterium]